ncbi:MAG: serine hydrolase [Microbacterium sp.]
MRAGARRDRAFDGTRGALEALGAAGARVSVRVIDLDSGEDLLAIDPDVILPVAGLGVVPLLVEVAARLERGTLDAAERVERVGAEADVRDSGGAAGLWRRLTVPALPVADAAVLVAASSDAVAADALRARVGADAVRQRAAQLGVDEAGGVEAATGALAPLFAALVNAQLVSPAVSAQVAEWLSLNQDLALVAAGMGLDPFAHDDDRHGLLFVNKTGRADGIRAEAGALAGPRAGAAYAVTVVFDDVSIVHRLRAHDALHALGIDLMEYTH